jgi:hypothetical protein
VTRDFQNLAAQQTSAVDFTFSNSHKEIYLRKQWQVESICHMISYDFTREYLHWFIFSASFPATNQFDESICVWHITHLGSSWRWDGPGHLNHVVKSIISQLLRYLWLLCGMLPI